MVATSPASYTWLESQQSRLSKLPKPTAHEEQALARAWQKRNDAAARERLVEAHLDLVVYLAKRLRGYGVPLEELMAEGNLGLLRAVDRFDKRGVRFRTYATFWVRAYMLAHALRSTSVVVNSTGAVGAKLFFKLRSARAKLETKLGAHQTEAVEAALAQQFSVTVEQIRAHTQRMQGLDVSVDQPAGEDGDSTMVDLMAADQQSPEELSAQRQRENAVRMAVAGLWESLDHRERAVLQQRLMDGDSVTLAELGEGFGLSRERLRQIEARLKARLKRALLASPQLTVH